MKRIRTEVCVVGGGAAGLMAALAAAEAGAEVLVLEGQERPARKLRITGKGRCNLTNNCPPEEVMANVTRNARFLHSALRAFPPSEVMAYFEGLGIPLKTERGNRVFPVSDRAGDVADALISQVERKAGILRLRAGEVLTEGGAVCGVRGGGTVVECRAAILCTGGLSYPKTGSTGDGYEMARALGHTVKPTSPSLVPLTSPDGDCAEMQGLSLRNVTMSLYEAGEGKKKLWSELGEMQFAHFGLTGPLALSASAHMEPGKRYTVELDLKPGLTEEKLDARLLRMFGENRNRDYRNSLDDLLPRSLIPVVIRRSGIPPDTKVHDITRPQRLGLLKLLKRFTVEIDGLRPIEEAVITRGGVDVREVDPKTMASRLVPGLWFAGEILDLDAYTGGFNLQIAWSTGRAAGRAAAAYSERKRSMKNIKVAIDGPGGAGKSTMAKALAKKCSLNYVDTGAMYRTIGLAVLRAGLDPTDGEVVPALLPTIRLGIRYMDGEQHMFLGEEDVTGLIRTPEVSAAASAVSAQPPVRAFLLKTQQDLAEECSVVMDGRDIGTVVLPHAQLKVFLTATAEERARRRFLELQERGTPQPFEQVLAEMNERDERDTNRAAAPLRAAEDAVMLDTTDMTPDEVLAFLRKLVEERRGE
jgi:cytidylate kinase